MTKAIYLPPERSGIQWLMDPESAELARLARDAHGRTADSPCDAAAVAADLGALPELLAARHFGAATGLVAPQVLDATEQLILAARDRVLQSRPRSWGDALGDLNDLLRLTLRDRHTRLQGSRKSAIRADEPAAVIDEHAPAVEVRTEAGVRCVVLRRLCGDASDDRLLWDWARDSLQHFEQDRIIVDLRGNGGGNDAITLEWIAPVLPSGAAVPGTSTGWYVGDTPLGIWNAVAMIEASQGADAVPSWHRDHLRHPAPADALVVRAEDDYPLPPGTRPWTGRMLVLVDRNTCSSGESSAWILQHALGARLAGGRTGGVIEYGNVVPYLLPASGLHVMLPTKHNDFGQPAEVIGLPVHAELDPRTPLAHVAATFDDLYRATERTLTVAEASAARASEARASAAQGSQARGLQAQGSKAQGSQAQGSQAQGTQAQGSQAQVRSQNPEG